MKKGSYGRSKIIGHSPIQKKWIFKGLPGAFMGANIIELAIFYANATDANINTIPSLNTPLVRVPISLLEDDPSLGRIYDFTKLIQTYKTGCYFFAWIDNTNTIISNQILYSPYDSEDQNEECFVFTPYVNIMWAKGLISEIRGIYVKNASLSSTTYVTTFTSENQNFNVFKITYGLPGDK